MTPRRQRYNRGALELIEEATHLLRTAPVSLLAIYYAGTLPFGLGLLFFVSEMGGHPKAEDHVVVASLGLAGLFLWMKTFQALFARHARAFVTGIAPLPLTARGVLRIAGAELAFQPFGLILIPIAAVLTVPFAWVYSFFQNLTVLADGSPATLRGQFRRALKLCALWPTENQAVKFTMFGFLLCVFLNWTILGFGAPQLLKMLLGIETTFSRSPMAMLNTTFFTAMLTLTYLSVDPILKVIHVLRCFYGEALTDGADLKVELRRHRNWVGGVTAGLLVVAVCLGANLAGAQPAPGSPLESPSPATTPVSPLELDRSIRETLKQRKFMWRMPREALNPVEEVTPQGKGMIERFFEKLTEFLGKVMKGIVTFLDAVLRRLFGGWNPRPISADTGFSWMAFQRLMLYVLGAAVIGALTYLAYRLWRSRRSVVGEVTDAAPLQPVPDLSDENIGAEQLPEDGWTRLARELLERGEYRLALRAFYLATLAHLAARNLITLAQFKSNRDYQQELQRRGHALAELLPPFQTNVADFERVWYGTFPATQAAVTQFAANMDRIKSIA